MVEVQSNNPYRRSMSPQPPPPAAGQHHQQQQQQQQQYQLSSYSSSSPIDHTGSGMSGSPIPPHSYSHSPSPPPLVKFPSSTTTIAEEPENEMDAQHPGHVRSPTPTIVVKACEDKERECSDTVVITIHPTTSTSSVPQHKEYPMPVRTNTNPHPRQSMNEPCSVWPARRFMQKQVMQKKTKWIIIKVLCALIFIVGAVAIGLGISKAAGGK